MSARVKNRPPQEQTGWPSADFTRLHRWQIKVFLRAKLRRRLKCQGRNARVASKAMQRRDAGKPRGGNSSKQFSTYAKPAQSKIIPPLFQQRLPHFCEIISGHDFRIHIRATL